MATARPAQKKTAAKKAAKKTAPRPTQDTIVGENVRKLDAEGASGPYSFEHCGETFSMIPAEDFDVEDYILFTDYIARFREMSRNKASVFESGQEAVKAFRWILVTALGGDAEYARLRSLGRFTIEKLVEHATGYLEHNGSPEEPGEAPASS